MEHTTIYHLTVDALGRQLAKEDILGRKYRYAKQRLLQFRTDRGPLRANPNRPTQECGLENVVNDTREELDIVSVKNYELVIDLLGRELAKEDIFERKCHYANQHLLQLRANREWLRFKPNKPTQECGRENRKDYQPNQLELVGVSKSQHRTRAHEERTKQRATQPLGGSSKGGRLELIDTTKPQRWMRVHEECNKQSSTQPLGEASKVC